jgi:hypothetical protein
VKLFQVDITYETVYAIGEWSDLTVAKSKEDAEDKISDDFAYNILSCTVCEIRNVDGYKIVLEKGRK